MCASPDCDVGLPLCYIAADEVEWDYLPLGKGMCADPNANPAAGLDAAYIDPTVPFKLVRQTRS